MSHGEKRRLDMGMAIGRALMASPRLLVRDEATEWLAPLVRVEIWRGFGILKERGESIQVIDKHLGSLLKIADRHHVLQKGKVAWQGASSELTAEKDIQSRYLGV